MGGGLEEGSVGITPGPKGGGFKISVLGVLKTSSFFDLENVSKSGSKRDLQIDVKLIFSRSGACWEDILEKC